MSEVTSTTNSISRKQYAPGEWNNEAQVVACLNRSPVGVKLKRWLSFGSGKIAAIRMNWISSLMAFAILWGFAIAVLQEPAETVKEFKVGKAWVSANFTWLYIGSLCLRTYSLFPSELQLHGSSLSTSHISSSFSSRHSGCVVCLPDLSGMLSIRFDAARQSG